jgi:hypothetical protein
VLVEVVVVELVLELVVEVVEVDVLLLVAVVDMHACGSSLPACPFDT